MSTRTDRIALGWGFAEATMFFIVPDVFLTHVAIRMGFRRSLRAALLATVGAIIGGLILFQWATVNPEGAFKAMDAVPAIDAEMINTVRADIASNGNGALVTGPLRGQPYKLFAAASGELGLSGFGLAMLTIPGRMVRFLLAIGIASYLRWVFSRWLSERVMLGFWAGIWLLIYVGYWFR